jgi:deoxyribonuclease V
MKCNGLHNWDVTPKEALEIQNGLQKKLSLKAVFKKIEKIGGVDVSYAKRTNALKAAIVILSFPSLEIIETVEKRGRCNFPYVPGLLTFREGPIILEAFEKLKELPDVLLFDGQGIAHPRRMGIAAHLGILLDLPTIGCAKSLLCGEFEEPMKEKGSRSFILDKEEIVGVALRTRVNVKPLFVSPGNKIDLKTSIEIALASSSHFRIPVPLRWAHSLSQRGMQ